jgi:nitroimidazol reductase NimA-like FMN-containing flavoprotein (pyridoxamine 5'-phosphate oxidase superfamily)
VTEPSTEVAEVLERGSLCYVATATRRGPHVTPMVFAVSGHRLWVTTARGSVKARAWRDDPAVAGLVRWKDVAVAFTGRVRTFDLLETASWGRDLVEAPALALASARFTRKNARFFAGYAVDAHHVPLSWTPPGRVFTAIELERTATLRGGVVAEAVGGWSRGFAPAERFRARRSGPPPLDGLPPEVAQALGASGAGALAVHGAGGVVVLPCAWVVDGAGLYAALPERALELADLGGPTAPVALAIDRASWWRARSMIGGMVRGQGEAVATDRLVSGGRSADRIVEAAGMDPAGAAIVRLRPERLVWWRGWSSGTVDVS